MERIVEAVSAESGCNEGDIPVKGRKKNKAGELQFIIARDLGGLPCKTLGTYFNGISGAAITTRYKQAARETASDKRPGRKANRIKKRIFNS